MARDLFYNLVSGLKSAVDSTGLRDVVLGLSGGIDSALAAAIACKALGPERVHPYYLPYKTSNPQSAGDAALMAASLKLSLETIDITPMADAYISTRRGITPVRAGNVMARVRMTILFDMSAHRGALVLGTGNRSEILLGYSTWYGDSACSVNPIGDLYKTEVWDLARHIGLPEVVINKAPSADLREGQTDEGDFGFTYQEADPLLIYLYDENHTAEDAAAAGFAPELIDKVTKRIRNNEYKRRLPVIVPKQP